MLLTVEPARRVHGVGLLIGLAAVEHRIARQFDDERPFRREPLRDQQRRGHVDLAAADRIVIALFRVVPGAKENGVKRAIRLPISSERLQIEILATGADCVAAACGDRDAAVPLAQGGGDATPDQSVAANDQVFRHALLHRYVGGRWVSAAIDRFSSRRSRHA